MSDSGSENDTGLNQEDEAISDWLSGGTLGSKNAVLVFRSCVLASPALSSPNKSVTATTNNPGGAMLLNKAKNMAKRLVSDPHSYNSQSKKTVLMHDVMESFGTAHKYETTAFVVRHRSLESLSSSPEPSCEGKERNIDDVLNDLNKITLKKHLNIENTTCNIKTNDEQTQQVKKEKKVSNCVRKGRGTKNKKTPVTKPPISMQPPNIELSSSESIVKSIESVPVLDSNRMPASMVHMTYKLVNTETRLLHRLLQAHGLEEVTGTSRDFNLLWSGAHPKPDLLRSLSPYQRINHFPRSYELTRKDKLFKNIEKWQYFRGIKHFDFIPMTFLMPVEYKDLCTTHYRTRGPWIVKPAASSRGRGIYIVNSPEQIPKGDNVVVAKYIDRPLLIGGHKCDLRLYVCVTSIDPLLIYLYEEGLVRFATVKYDKSNKNLWNPCMHLCNYSINKYHTDYVQCDDPNAGNIGHKWTLSALLRHLRKQGRNTTVLMASIEDLVIKSILSSSQTIAAASRVFVPNFNNCFELFGYDILVDDMLKPWLLEINLSPSLNCESPLDAKVKSALIADLLTLVGLPAVSITNREVKGNNLKMRIGACRRVHSAETSSGLSGEEARLVRAVRSQYARRGGFVRIFPSQNSWQNYSQYLDPVTGIPVCSTSLNDGGGVLSVVTHNYNLMIHSHVLPHFYKSQRTDVFPDRLKRYESAVISSAAPAVSLIESRPPPVHDARLLRMQIKEQLAKGNKLTAGEARRAFAMFLCGTIRKMVSGESTVVATLVLKFLKRAGPALRVPFIAKSGDDTLNVFHSSQLSPPPKMCDKDKCAMIAKQLNDFLYLYYRETDLYTDSQDQENCISNIQFSQFLYSACEADLEEILLQSAEISPDSCASWLGSLQLGTTKPQGPRHHNLLRKLATSTIRRHHARDVPPLAIEPMEDDLLQDVKDSLKIEKPVPDALKFARS